MVVYHGTPKPTIDLNPDNAHGTLWTTDNPEYAELFSDKGAVHKLEANMKNKLNMKSETEELPLEEWINILDEKGIDISDLDLEKMNWAPDYGLYTFYDLLPHAGNNYLDTGVLNKIKKAGYDSIIAPEEFQNKVGSKNTYVLLNKNIFKRIGEWSKGK